MPSAPNIFLLAFVLTCGMPSCSRHSRLEPTVDVTIQNDSTNHLDWVEVDWGGRVMTAGVSPPGKGATELDAGLPVGVATNVAMIKFINEDDPRLSWTGGSNEEVRARRAISWTQVPVDVNRLQQLGPGHYKITFRILSLTNAELLIE